MNEGDAEHEERIKRRMANEYERAGRLLSQTVGDNLDARLYLNSIRVQGATNTRAQFLAKICAPYLEAPAGSVDGEITLRQLLKRTRSLADRLTQFDIFKNVEATLEDSPSVLARPGDVDLVMTVSEASRLFLRTATDIGNGEGSATATAKIRNVFGGAELLEANAAYGTRTKSSYALRLEVPLLGNPLSRLELGGYATERDLSLWASCREHLQGANVKWKLADTPLGYQELAYEAVMRRIHDLQPHASMSMRNSAGYSIKSALSHTLISDTRDDPFMASHGRFYKVYQELAGLSGDAQHYKMEGEVQTSRSFGLGYTISLALRSGLLLPFGRNQTSYFSDRFRLGGPTSVRAFKVNHLGPKDNGDYIGGDLTYSAGLSLLTPFYPKPEWPLKGHLFLNAGSLQAWSEQQPTAQERLARWLTQPTISAGFGLMFRHSQVRIEANFGVPLVAHKTDGAVKGFQFGLGLSFL